MSEQKDETGRELSAIVVHDVKTQMIKLTNAEPINNAGSFALTLLWQIFEAAHENFEEWEALSNYRDDEIEASFKIMFPVFISEYPKAMVLDA